MRGLRLWAPVVGWCAVIFFFSAQPDLETGLEYDYPLRKVAHLVEYAVLWALSRRAFAGSGASRPGATAFALSALYAASDEWHQSFVPGRAGRASDVLLDALGAALAAAVRSWRRY